MEYQKKGSCGFRGGQLRGPQTVGKERLLIRSALKSELNSGGESDGREKQYKRGGRSLPRSETKNAKVASQRPMPRLKTCEGNQLVTTLKSLKERPWTQDGLMREDKASIGT